MKLFIAGVGSGNSEFITIAALNAAKDSDLIIVPRSNMNNSGMAENIISQFLPEREIIPLYFPMTKNEAKRDKIILEQLEKINSLNSSQKIFFPVIGDSLLYSTGAYFIQAMKKLFDCEINFIPGISAHSSASALAKRFLAMKDEIFSIIPGTADPEKIKSALETCDSAAIYKPSALSDIKFLLEYSRKWEIIRVDYAGIPELEKIFTGSDALNDLNNYMSIILLYRANI